MAILGVLSFAGWITNRFFINHNFHTVSPGTVYRSAQLDATALTKVIEQNGIKSILNLRGGHSSSGWYNAETNAARQLGVRYYDYELSASEELTDGQMNELVTMIGNAPKPLLIHCKSGADRTGLVGALYLYNFEGKSAEVASEELTLLYGHVPYFFWHDTVAMDHSFSRYVAAHPSAHLSPKKHGSPLTRRETSTALMAN